MALTFRRWPQHGVIAIFNEAPGGGDISDIDADCNRPAASPEDWLENIKFHSGLRYLEVAATDQTTKSHSSASSGSTGSGGTGVEVNANSFFGYRRNVEDFAICTHGLGYEPYAAVIVDGSMLFPGMPVQVGSGGAARYATAYVTTTQVRVQSWCSVGASNLSADNITYKAIVFREPRTASGDTLYEFDPSTGVAKMGHGKFQSDREYLQVEDGATPFGILTGRGGDLNNGAPRFVRANGSTYDPVPNATKLKVGPSPIEAFGDSMTYGGGFSAPDIINVQVPDAPPGGDSDVSFDPATGVLKFLYNGRETLTGAGKLISLLPEITVNNQAVNFPDLNKEKNYRWGWSSQYSGLVTPPYSWNSGGIEAVVAPPQEWSNTTNLMAVPAGADFIIGRARLNRTSAPDNWLFDDPLEVIPKTGEWIPFMGALTMLVEAGYGFARMFSVFISGSNLVLRREHSVSNRPGGYGSWGDGAPLPLTTSSGGHINGFGDAGIIVRTHTGKFSSGETSNTTGVDYTKHRWNGSDPDSLGDNTDFSSQYDLDLRFSFGTVS